MTFTYISDGVCIIDCKTEPGSTGCNGDRDNCPMYLEYKEWRDKEDKA